MGERKVLNRYFPPDFDPLLVPKRKYDPYKQVEVRMMIPFSLQCIKCGEYMYRGKKFNSRKEDVIGDDYLGIKKYRFYIKCCVCNNEIAFKTDPKNQDYVCESGAWAAPFVFFASLFLHDVRGGGVAVRRSWSAPAARLYCAAVGRCGAAMACRWATSTAPSAERVRSAAQLAVAPHVTGDAADTGRVTRQLTAERRGVKRPFRV